MKAFKYTSILVISFLVLISCKNETAPETKIVDHGEKTKEKILNPNAAYVAANFEIDGMMCAMGCAKVIEKNLAQMDGVRSVQVDFETKLAKIEYDEDMVNPDLVIASVKKTGESYKVTSWNGESLSQPKENIEE